MVNTKRSAWAAVLGAALAATACNAILGLNDAVVATASDAGANGPFDATVGGDATADGAPGVDAGGEDANAADGATSEDSAVTDASVPFPSPTAIACEDGGCAAGSVCVYSACLTGDCITTADCQDSGLVCVGYQCNPCTQDFQCTEAYGPTYSCLGQQCAAPPAGCTSTRLGRSCGSAGDHVCCLLNNTGLDVDCVAGNCCSVGSSDPTCVGNHLVNAPCAPVPLDAGTPTYYVDPEAGADYGNSGSAACPFRTLTYALGFVGAPASAAVVQVLGATNPELSPVAVPANVDVEGPDGSAPLTLVYPDGGMAPTYGVVLGEASSRIGGFSWSKNTSAMNSVAIQGGAAGSSLHHYAVSGVITVGTQDPTAVVTVGPGVNAGTFSNVLHVAAGHVLVLGGPGADSTDLYAIHDIGIYVTGLGSVEIDGPSDGGSAPASGVTVNGISIAQVPGENLPPNRVTGLSISTGFSEAASRIAPGIVVYGGSSLVVRATTFSYNQGPGLSILPGTDGTAASLSTAGIDLGTAGSPGRNTFTGNCGANLWIGFVPSAPIPAEGNIWDGTDCTAAAPAPISDGVPLCIEGLNPGGTKYEIGLPADDAGLPKGAVDVAACTLQ